jgi:GxxExxY protein
VVELKVARELAPIHQVQVINYLRSTAFEVGLLLNFGQRAQIRRFVFSNARKQAVRDPRSSA